MEPESYNEGYKAYETSGIDAINPYGHDSEEHAAWERGCRKAMSDECESKYHMPTLRAMAADMASGELSKPTMIEWAARIRDGLDRLMGRS